jgi:hypothetical protein
MAVFIISTEIKPFHLWVLPEDEAHLCPVRAIAAWLRESRIDSGYIFRKIYTGDRIAEANIPMVCSPSPRLPQRAELNVHLNSLLNSSWNSFGTISWS